MANLYERSLPEESQVYAEFIQSQYRSAPTKQQHLIEVEKAVLWISRCPSLSTFKYTFEQRDYMWDGEVASFWQQTGPNILHDAAHWLVASEVQRRCIDFGIGGGPDSRHAVPESHKGYLNIASDQELDASVLGISIQYALGFPTRHTMMSHSWMPVGGNNDDCESLFRSVYKRLDPIFECLFL